MSRSYRKPYAAITGNKSAADDKRMARRGVRVAEKQALRVCTDWDEFLIPNKYECSFNETYSWGRDGCQYLHFAPRPNEIHFHWNGVFDRERFDRSVEYYESLKRK